MVVGRLCSSRPESRTARRGPACGRTSWFRPRGAAEFLTVTTSSRHQAGFHCHRPAAGRPTRSLASFQQQSLEGGDHDPSLQGQSRGPERNSDRHNTAQPGVHQGISGWNPSTMFHPGKAHEVLPTPPPHHQEQMLWAQLPQAGFRGGGHHESPGLCTQEVCPHSDRLAATTLFCFGVPVAAKGPLLI